MLQRRTCGLGGTSVVQRENTTLRYTHQDHLSGTSLMTDTNGNSLGTMKYYPFGSTRSGSVPTDELFTGQKLDGTGLYYYGARYYDPTIGRFISPDTIIPNPADPQSYNRYSYCLNNPLKYIDPSGHDATIYGMNVDNFWQNMYATMGVAGSASIMSDACSLYAGYNLAKDNNDKAKQIYTMLENSSLTFNIIFDDNLEEGYGGAFTPNSSGGEVAINGNIFRNAGSKAIAWAESHELGHASGRTISIQKPSLWEETLVMQFQYQVGQSIGFDPFFWPGILAETGLNSPIQDFNDIIHEACEVNLASTRSPYQDKQLKRIFYPTSYWYSENYRDENSKTRYYPGEAYMRQIYGYYY